MKKLTALVLAALLSLSALTLISCDKEDAEGATTTAGESQAEGAGEAATDAPATDAPATEPEETDPPKPRDEYDYIMLYDAKDGGHGPHSLMAEGSSVGVRFKFDKGFLTDGNIQCPSWSNNEGNLTLKIFTWNTDYATTVAGEPVYTQVYENYNDNATLTYDFSTEESLGLAAGEYLWWMGEGVDASGSGVGLWIQAAPTDPKISEVYVNGELNTDVGPEGEMNIIIPGEA